MWNPTTNEVHHIPHAPSPRTDFSYGFGAVASDFKVIRLTSYHKGMTTFLCPFAEVYSLNTKSWTIIRCPCMDVTNYRPSRYINEYRHPSSKYNALVNGIYYWITSSNLDIFPTADILCFNFCNHKFRKLKSPMSNVIRTTYCHDLIEIEGSLGYVMQSNTSSYNVWFEIWVIDQNKWSKKYAIETSTLSLRRFGNDAAEIFGGKAGELLKSYDHHGKKLRQFQTGIPKMDYFKIYEYVPSITLLSIK
jgi:F-box interacting protein